MKTLGTLLTVCFGLLLIAPVFAAEMTCDIKAPIRGQDTFIRLHDVEAPTVWTVSATYRPNSATARTDQLGTVDDEGKLRWRPTDSGIVQFSAKGPGEKDKAGMTVAVRFPSPPISGIIILLVAGTILFGGAGYSLHRAMKG